MKIPHERIDLKRIVIFLLFAAFAIAIASLTIGRDIYYGEREHGLLSFAIVSLAGYLFFLFIPVELAFVYYISSGENIWLLMLIAIVSALISQSIDYLIGYSVSSKFIDKMIGRQRFESAEAQIRRYGNVIIFIFNFLPLASPVILLASGMLKHRFKDTFLFMFIGLVIKYFLLVLAFHN